MATKDFEILDMQNDDQEINIPFHNSDHDKEQTVYFSNFPNSATDEDHDGDLSVQTEESGEKSSSFLTFEYYQQFFNVESKQVTERIVWSIVPKPGMNYLQTHIRPNPDLYGPFWIAVTLVFTTAVTGNIANYFQSKDANHWKYDFHKVTLCTSFIFSYAIIVPIFMWGILLWRKSQTQLSLLEVVCLYGYSLAVFVPVSVLWLFPIAWLQWCLGIVASALSGCVLVKTITPSVQHEGKKIAMVVGVLIIVLHAALALGFMLYFFYPPSVPIKPQEPVNIANITATKNLPDFPDLGKEVEKDLGINKRDENTTLNNTVIDDKILHPGQSTKNTIVGGPDSIKKLSTLKDSTERLKLTNPVIPVDKTSVSKNSSAEELEKEKKNNSVGDSAPSNEKTQSPTEFKNNDTSQVNVS